MTGARAGAPEHEHEHDHPHGAASVLPHFLRPHSHDVADSIDTALTTSDEGIRAVKLSLLALGLTAAAQSVVVVFSGSVALLADTVHNVSDALTAIPLWIAFVLGRRPATRSATYGYGRAEDIAGLFILATIALSTIVAAWQGISRLVNPEPIHQLGWVAVAGLIGFLGNELVAGYRIRVGKRIGSAALVADGHHARTDGFTSLAVVLGAGGVALGWQWADPVVGLLISVAIGVILVTAAREVFRRLLDIVDPDLIETAEASLAGQPGVVEVRRVRMRWIGHELHADADLVIAPNTPLEDAHRIAHSAEHRLTHAVPRLTEAVVHAYPPMEHH